MTGDDCEVLVVGAGPVGVVLAHLLGANGVRTTVVDRELGVLRIPRAIALDDDGSRVLETIGVLADVEGDMPRIERVRMISPTVGDLFAFDANRWRDGYAMVRMFRQPELEDALRAGLARHASVRLRTGVEVERIEMRDHEVRVWTRNRERPETITARYVVGCDGARSTVRKLLGVELAGSTYERDWLVVDALRDPTPNREVHFLCDPRRPGVTMPAPGGGRRWEFMLGDGDDRATINSPSSLRRLLAPWGDPDVMGIERSAVYTFHARVAERLRRDRVFLAGDAAHLTPPFAGQGLMAGLRDATNLAWKLAYALRGEAGDALLDTYETERLPNARTMVDLARLMGEIIMARDPARCLVRDRLLAPIARLPLVRETFSSLELKPRTALSDGLLHPGVIGELRAGTLLPQGAAEDGEGHVERLDRRIGYRLAVVGLGVDPTSWLRRDQQRWLASVGTSVAIGDDRSAPRALGAEHALVDRERALVDTAPVGTCLVVRPDRHLYAVVPAGALEPTVDRLRRTLGTIVRPSPPGRAARAFSGAAPG